MEKFISMIPDEGLNDTQRATLARLGYTDKVVNSTDGDYPVSDLMWMREVKAKSYSAMEDWESENVYSLPEFKD